MSAIKSVLDQLLRWVCVVLFAALLIVVCWQVFTRQVLHAPATWTTATAQYLFVWLSLFGAAYVFSDKSHIAVDFLVRILKINEKRSTEIFVHVIILAFAVLILIWGGMRGVNITWSQNASGIPVNVGSMYLALPISGVIVAFYSIYHMIEAFHGRGLPDESDEKIAEVV